MKKTAVVIFFTQKLSREKNDKSRYHMKNKTRFMKKNNFLLSGNIGHKKLEINYR